MKLLLFAVLVLTAAGAKWASNRRKDVSVKKFGDASCSAATDSWEVKDAVSPLFLDCTASIKSSGDGGAGSGGAAGGSVSIGDLTLAQLRKATVDQGMRIQCVDGAYKILVYDDPMSCSTTPLTQESFAKDQTSKLALGACAKTTSNTSYQIVDLGSISLLDCDIVSSSDSSSDSTSTTTSSQQPAGSSDSTSTTTSSQQPAGSSDSSNDSNGSSDSSSDSNSNTTSSQQHAGSSDSSSHSNSTTTTSSQQPAGSSDSSSHSNSTTTGSQQEQQHSAEPAASSSNSSSAGVIGDPHLTNVRGERFDIHDGLHRLVHYPRGVSKEEALLMVDARAVDMGKTKDCYSVYLDSVKISGKWVGDEISFSSHANASEAGSNPSVFFMSFASESLDWPTLAKLQDAHLKLKGSVPVTVTPSTRNASGDDPAGGPELTLKIGEQHPVLVQVWSSYAFNALTSGQQVGYLNVQVKNLPASAGGIIGLDSYSRPSNAHCELVQEEKNLLDDIKAEASAVDLLRLKRPRWTALATTQEQ